MSFDGRDNRHGNSGPDEVVELPAKLAALAEQLSDDADSLALRYPAPERCGRAAFEVSIAEAMCRPSGALSERASDDTREIRAPAGMADWGTLRRWSIVSGVCAAMLFVVVTSWEGVVRWREGGDPPPSAAAHLTNPPGALRVEKDIGHSSGQAALPREATLLRGLSAAEQEAVLDLLEHGPEGSVSLSI
jgi:hypothetical protein